MSDRRTNIMIDSDLNTIPYFGPHMMRIGQELVIKAHGSGAAKMRRQKYVLMEKYPKFGLFRDIRMRKKIISWWEVYRLGQKDTTVTDGTVMYEKKKES